MLGESAELPSVTAGMYLVECAIECASLEWKEIKAWAESVDVEFSPWEFRLMRELYGQYLQSRTSGKDRNAKAPYRTGQVANKQAVADQVRRALRGS